MSDRATPGLRLPERAAYHRYRSRPLAGCRMDVPSSGLTRPPPPCARSLICEGVENPGAMPNPTDGRPAERGPLAASISTGVVHVFTEHTGRGPTRVRTTIDGDLVVVVLHDGQTKAERSLVRAGREDTVLHLRSVFQETMSADLIAVVERLTRRKVQAFMSANHADPDAAAEIFMLDGEVDTATPPMTAA